MNRLQTHSRLHLLATIFLVSSLCFSIQAKESDSTLNQISDSENSISFSFPKGWFKNAKENPFDLQAFSKNQRMNTGVFVTKTVDLAATTKPLDIYQSQIEDIRGKRKNFSVIAPQATYQLSDKTITRSVFSGEKGAAKFYYTMSLIEFKQSKKLFAITLQVSFPSGWNEDKAKLKAIIDSAILL